MRRSSPPDGQRGSVLLLVPSLVLVVFLLGALAVDASLVFLAERQVANLAASAANDAATAAVDRAGLYEGGAVVLDGVAARAAAEATVAVQAPARLADLALDVAVDPAAGRVTVTVTGTVDHLFADAVPGAAAGTAVGATATAAAVEE